MAFLKDKTSKSKFKIFLKWVQFIADVASSSEEKYNKHILGIEPETIKSKEHEEVKES